MNEQKLRWDDLQIVQSVAASGSLSGAGRQLGLSHATIFRRLTDMEQRLGVSLFERSRSGYSPTPAGEDLAKVAARMEADVLGAERRLAGKDLKLSGTIRITTTDTLFAGLLAPAFASFRHQYPDITLETVISNQRHSLSKREADIAIRPTHTPPESLVGRRIGDIQLAVYGQRLSCQTCSPANESLSDQPWVGPDVHMGDSRLEAWMQQERRSEQCHFRVDSLLGMQAAIRQGIGIGILPCYLGNSDEQLLRLTPPVEKLTTPLWLLTHPDLKKVARIRAFMDEITNAVRPGLEGEPTSGKSS